MCHNINHPNIKIERLRLFQNNNNNNIIIIIKTRGNTSFAFNCDQNSCILVIRDNTYTM